MGWADLVMALGFLCVACFVLLALGVALDLRRDDPPPPDDPRIWGPDDKRRP